MKKAKSNSNEQEMERMANKKRWKKEKGSLMTKGSKTTEENKMKEGIRKINNIGNKNGNTKMERKDGGKQKWKRMK